MLEGGAFDDIDVALSSHPMSERTVFAATGRWTPASAWRWWATATASTARRCTLPASRTKAVNALNAVIHLITGIDAMRQHLRDDVRIHGIISDGGGAPNVVPEFAAANFMLRSRDKGSVRSQARPT